MTENANVATATVENANVVKTTSKKQFTKGKKDFTPKKEYVRPEIPGHLKNLVLLMKNNAEIRRFTALGVIDALKASNELKGEKHYVDFKFNHFVVSDDGLRRDYRYTEIFFLNALVESFSRFAASAQNVINEFIKIENVPVAGDNKD